MTRPSRIASDLLYDHEEPAAVAQIVVNATQKADGHAGAFADALAPHAARFGLRRSDGLALLRWMYDLIGGPESDHWMNQASAHVSDRGPRPAPANQHTSSP